VKRLEKMTSEVDEYIAEMVRVRKKVERRRKMFHKFQDPAEESKVFVHALAQLMLAELLSAGHPGKNVVAKGGEPAVESIVRHAIRIVDDSIGMIDAH
jgi:hypothetical protein